MPLRKPSGKRVASGSTKCSNDTISFRQYNGVNQNFLYLTVTGLPFVPSQISITRPTQEDFSLTYDVKRGTSGGIAMVYYTGTGYTIASNIGGAFVNNIGFRLPVSNAETNGNYNWTAYE